MKVLINMIPQPGHINPTLPLARALAARGHEIVYTSFLDLKSSIETHGFRCRPIHCDIVPRGLLPFVDELVTSDERDYIWGTIHDRVHEEYFDVAPMAECLASERPDIVLTDVVPVSPMQFAAHRLGLPCLQLCTSLPQWHDPALPPLTSGLLPGAPALELQAAQLQGGCLAPLSNFPQLPGMFTWLLGAYCARHGYPPEEISFRSVFWPELTRLPEAVLAAAALDYPRQGPRRPNYIATAPALDREEAVAPALRQFVAGGGGPLIYASLGSQPSRYPQSTRFFQALIETCRARPEWRVAVTTGPRYLKSRLFADKPVNLFTMASAPQLWLLRHCAAFVTHAGLGGMREAVALNVPMIAVPQQYDQPGNAARIEYHRIGRRIPADLVNAAGLIAEIEEVLEGRDGYRERLAALDRRCREEEQAGAGVELVEKIAVTAPPGVSAGAATRKAAKSSVVTPLRAANDPLPPAVREGYLFVGDEAGYRAFAPGARLSSPDGSALPELGVAGYRVSPDLAHALSASAGPLLCRVSLSGETASERGYALSQGLRSRWLADVSEALYEYAAWCVRQISERMRARAPAAARGMLDVLDRFHELRCSGASLDALVRHYVHVQSSTASYWNQGFGAALMAIDLMPNKAAQLARVHALVYLNDGGADDAAYTDLKARLDAELLRLVARDLRAAGIDESPLVPPATQAPEEPARAGPQRARAI